MRGLSQKDIAGQNTNGRMIIKPRPRRESRDGEKTKAQLKRYALEILPTLSPQLLRTLVVQKKLCDGEVESLDEMRSRIVAGAPKEKVWERASSRERTLFKKLQQAGVK